MSRILIAGAAGLVAALGFATVASANPDQSKHSTPSSFKYETDGKSYVKKGTVVTQADGSTRKEVPLNSRCVQVTVSTKTEYRTTRECKKD